MASRYHVEVDYRKIAIELQRSYQSVDDYVRRQERYQRHHIECFWLTRRENIVAIAKRAGRLGGFAARRASGRDITKVSASGVFAQPTKVLTLHRASSVKHLGRFVGRETVVGCSARFRADLVRSGSGRFASEAVAFLFQRTGTEVPALLYPSSHFT